MIPVKYNNFFFKQLFLDLKHLLFEIILIYIYNIRIIILQNVNNTFYNNLCIYSYSYRTEAPNVHIISMHVATELDKLTHSGLESH